MARDRKPKGKIVRRLQENIFGNPKYSRLLERRQATPGGRRRRRPHRESEYARQLNEKQKLKLTYGMSEAQFRRFFAEAQRLPGDTGENFLVLLERRLDNVVYRLGMASTRAEARQVVSHGHIRVNGRTVTIPSRLVEPGDTIDVRPRHTSTELIDRQLAANTHWVVPEWLALVKAEKRATVLRMPARDEIGPVVDEALVVEFYSR